MGKERRVNNEQLTEALKEYLIPVLAEQILKQALLLYGLKKKQKKVALSTTKIKRTLDKKMDGMIKKNQLPDYFNGRRFKAEFLLEIKKIITQITDLQIQDSLLDFLNNEHPGRVSTKGLLYLKSYQQKAEKYHNKTNYNIKLQSVIAWQVLIEYYYPEAPSFPTNESDLVKLVKDPATTSTEKKYEMAWGCIEVWSLLNIYLIVYYSLKQFFAVFEIFNEIDKLFFTGEYEGMSLMILCLAIACLVVETPYGKMYQNLMATLQAKIADFLINGLNKKYYSNSSNDLLMEQESLLKEIFIKLLEKNQSDSLMKYEPASYQSAKSGKKGKDKEKPIDPQSLASKREIVPTNKAKEFQQCLEEGRSVGESDELNPIQLEEKGHLDTKPVLFEEKCITAKESTSSYSGTRGKPSKPANMPVLSNIAQYRKLTHTLFLPDFHSQASKIQAMVGLENDGKVLMKKIENAWAGKFLRGQGINKVGIKRCFQVVSLSTVAEQKKTKKEVVCLEKVKTQREDGRLFLKRKTLKERDAAGKVIRDAKGFFTPLKGYEKCSLLKPAVYIPHTHKTK